MIVKNHNIVLADTSPAELARFRQIMLGIWRQQIDDDKNAAEMLKYVKEHYQKAKELDEQYANNPNKPEEISLKDGRYILDNGNHYQYVNAIALNEVVVTAYVPPLSSILNWIKKNFGNKAKELKLNSLPENTQLKFLLDNKNGHVIGCDRYQFETIVDLKNIEFAVYFRPSKTYFLLGIFDPQKNLVFRFQTDTYEGLEYLANFIGYDLEAFKITITNHYKAAIAAAGNDKDKLDVIYEVIPDFILASLKTGTELYEDIEILLNQNIFDLGGRDEDQGILNILKALNKQDGRKLYKWLEKRPKKVLQIYDSGKSIRNEFLKLIHELATKYGKQSSSEINKAYVSAKDSFILKNIFLNTYRLDTGLVNVQSVEGQDWSTFWADLAARYNIRDTKIGSDPIKFLTAPIQYGNPMHLASLTTAGQKPGEFIEKTETILMILHLSEQEKNKEFWELVSLTTSILGVASALRVIVVGGSKLAVTLAYIEITKEAAEMVMLNDKAKQILIKNDLGWLVDNWTKISIAVDITSFGLEGLINLIKKGRKGVKVLKEANQLDEVAHLEKQIEKDFTEIEKQTGVDARKMTDVKFEKFANQLMLNDRKIITLADVNQLGTAKKVELINEAGENVAYITRNMQYGAKKGITYNFNAIKESGTIKKGSKIDLKCEIKLLDSESAKKYDLTVKQNEEILYLDFNIPSKINKQYSGLGKIIFDDAHIFMQNSKKVPEINGMFGVWLKHPEYYVHYGGESINLKKFWKAVDSGMTEEKAAFETITGKWAKENGYTKVEIQGKIKKDEVIIKFLKE